MTVALAACEAEALTAAPDTEGSPRGIPAIDCPALIGASPSAAAEALRAEGLGVSWRLMHTASDGSVVADVVATPPESGKIIDVVFVGDEVILFVVDPMDPAAQSPPPPTC